MSERPYVINIIPKRGIVRSTKVSTEEEAEYLATEIPRIVDGSCSHEPISREYNIYCTSLPVYHNRL